MLSRAREESGLAIVTEVMSEEDAPMVAEYADILQIGTRNMENYRAAGSGGAVGPSGAAEARHGGHDCRLAAFRAVDSRPWQPQRDSLRARHPHL
jgi:hypothetical protein